MIVNKNIRKLISLKTISDIKPIDGADAIETAVLGGWNVVVKKDQFKKGETVLYFEIDSFLPDGVEQFQFLVDKSSKTALNDKGENVKGHVLRSIRLRGQLSQGLVLPVTDFPELELVLKNRQDNDPLTVDETVMHYFFEQLGVFKYEKPLPQSGNIIGDYPNFTQKTDSERVQNLTDDVFSEMGKSIWKDSEKIDGMSSTFWKDKTGKLRAAQRNYEIDLESTPLFKKIAEECKFDEFLKPGDVIKGEIAGQGINGNRLKLNYQRFFKFDWESDRKMPDEFKQYEVPSYGFEFPKTIEDAIEQVNGLKSLINPDVLAEGIVWWNTEGKTYPEIGYRPNFKVINNKYLIKHGE